MSEPEKPKRRWFQFHLLTMVLMTLTAGILIFVNITGAAKGSSLAADGIDYAYVRGPGWPEPFYFGRRHNLRFDEVETLERDLLTQYSRPKYFLNLATLSPTQPFS